MPWRFLAIALSVLLGLGASTCSSSKKDQMVPIGPSVKASLVVYFKADVTEEEINRFWEEVLSAPDPHGRGYYHRAGVGDISRIFPAVQGHEGIAVSFFPDATNDERAEIKHAVRSSPIVYKVLEDIAPADVKKLD